MGDGAREPSGEPERAQVLVLVRDLLFQSRITAAGARSGLVTRIVREPGQLAPDVPGRLAIVDLDQPGAMEAALAWAAREDGRRVAGFAQHVHVERIREAKAAGVHEVVPRSRFDAVLPRWLQSARAS